MKDPDEDYIDQDYTFVNFPWILDTQSKSDVLFLDSREKMKKEIDNEMLRNILDNPYAQNININFAYLYLEIDR